MSTNEKLNTENIVELLNRSRDLNNRFLFLLDECESLKSEAELQAYNSYDYVKVKSSVKNSYEDRLTKYIMLKEEAFKVCSELFELKGFLLDNINKLDNRNFRVVLISRYLSCETWQQISEHTEYSTKQLRRIHQDALNAINEYIS